jgi:glycosyltransferase involved in cell wall biosynthesis
MHLITLKPAVVCGLAALLTRQISGRPTRIVITIPGLGRLMSPGSTLQGTGAKLARFMVERTIRRLSAQKDVYFTFETHHDRSCWLRQGLIRPDNSLVISGAGVDPALFFPAGQRRGGRVRVLFASRLLKAKGLDAFLQAARGLSGRTDVEFLVAGMVEPHDPDGYSPDRLRSEPAITFLGEVSEMAELLRGVDIVCLPSRYGEGIPRILIEAAACGVASIASDLDGCREIVEDGVTGAIVPAAPPAETATAIEAAVRRYLDDRAQLLRHGLAAREKFLGGEFSEGAVVAHFLRLIVETG